MDGQPEDAPQSTADLTAFVRAPPPATVPPDRPCALAPPGDDLAPRSRGAHRPPPPARRPAPQVQNLLSQMQNRFQQMSDSIITRIDEMGERIDDLEKSVGDLVAQAEDDEGPPATPDAVAAK